MLTTVRLYGALGREFGRVHRYDIATPAEALRALRAQHPRFASRLIAQRRVRLLVDDAEITDIDALALRRRMRTVRVVPATAGAGFEVALGNFLFMTLGVELVTASTIAALATSAITSIVTSLVLGGIAQLLFAPPKPEAAAARERPENRPSYAFDGAVNTAEQGNPVAVLYGRMRVGSQVISAGLFAEAHP